MFEGISPRRKTALALSMRIGPPIHKKKTRTQCPREQPILPDLWLKSDPNLTFIIAYGHFYGLRQNIRIAVGDALKGVLLLVQLNDKNRRVDFFQRAGAFNGLSATTVCTKANF